MRGALPDDVTQIPDGQTWQWTNLTLGAGPARIIRWTSGYSETGSFGALDLATADKARLACEHAVDQFVALVCWVRDRPVEPGREHQATPPDVPVADRVQNAVCAAVTATTMPPARWQSATPRPPVGSGC